MLALVASAGPVWAHESRPAYLEINESTPGQYRVLWRTPVLSGSPLPVALKFPEVAKTQGEPVIQRLSDSIVERSVIDTGETGLAGQRIDFIGLQATITDVLVRVQLLNGVHISLLVHPREPWVDVPAQQGSWAVLFTYIRHGIDHILMGYDHLLFVLALMLIVRQTRVLIWTITSFTLAHSITLALATLGVVHVPGPPVEASIALSILLLAHEIGRLRRWEAQVGEGVVQVSAGITTNKPLTARWPWVVAFTFGLLHGFGFASALTEVGLPQSDLPLALFAFNLGVELGQLTFIAVVLSVLAIFRHMGLPQSVRRFAQGFATYAIGIMAGFWFLQRVSGF